MIKTIVIEDEETGREYLIDILQKYFSEIQVIAETGNVSEGIQLINRLNPDLIFLDINISGGSGFDILKMIKVSKPYVIFTTAHSEFALRAHKYNKVHDYLLKPIDLEDLTETLKRFHEYVDTDKKNANGKLRLSISNGYRYVPINDILYIKGQGSYSKVFWMNNKELLVTTPLKYFENQLPDIFIRTHKSFLVNKDRIEEFTRSDGFRLLLQEGHEVPVSRRLKDKVLDEILR